MALAVRLYLRAGRYDCVVLGGGRSDGLYALLCALLPVRRPLCIRIDCLWYQPKSKLRRLLKSLQFRIEKRAVDSYVVWASREIEAYSSEFSIPSEQFHFIPYHHTLNDLDIKPWDGGYVFAGGNCARDYRVFLDAVRGLNVPVKIGCSRPGLFRGLSIPTNVEIRSYTHQEFLRALAGCVINVVPLMPGLLHSGGQQTFLNSMALGKPTVVADPEGASDYIAHGETGLLVPAGDPIALRESIQMLLSDRDLAANIARNARYVLSQHSTEAHFRSLVAFIEERLETSSAGRRSHSPSAAQLEN